MAVTFVGWGTLNTAGGNVNFVNGGGNVTPALPAGIQEGDLIVLFCMNRDGASTAGFTSTGYATLDQNINTVGVAMLCKRAGQAAEANPTVSTTLAGGGSFTNDPTMVFAGAWRGVAFLDDTTTNELVRAATNSTTSLTYDYPAIASPGVDGALILTMDGHNNDAQTTNPTTPLSGGGYSGIWQETTAGSDASLAAAYQIQTTAAAISAGNFGGNTNTGGSTQLAVAIKAATPRSEAIVH